MPILMTLRLEVKLLWLFHCGTLGMECVEYLDL